MSRSSGHVVEFHYDISCPFAYIASTKVEALAARTGAKIIWRPVLLGAIYRATNAPQGAAGSASDVFNATKKAVSGRAFQRTIIRHGIPHKQPDRHPQKTTAALRLLYFVNEQYRPKLTHELFKLYWVDNAPVADKASLKRAVERCQFSGTETTRILAAIEDGSIEGAEQRQQLEASTDLAVKRGTPGVPGFWVPEEVWTDSNGKQHKGRLYWGQDRMQFVEAVLLALNEGKDGNSLSKIAKPLRSLTPRCVRGMIPKDQEVKLEFWYDFSSPWAFLGWTQLASLKRQFGDRLQIEMKPFLLGILFREIGAPNLPMAAISEQKRNYSKLDHGDSVRWWNAINVQEGKPDKNIDFYWADQFPIRTPTVLKAVLVEPKLCDVLYRACWERNLNMSDDKVLREVMQEAGYDAAKILAEANSDKIKQDLRARTKEAKDVGICGVPTYRVFHKKLGSAASTWQQSGDLVWGQDELAVVEDLIAGWDSETGVATVEEGRSRDSKL
ncbi:hypothetical protein CB0940_05386 [Cercospora beticola]|uniref:DSBA-like thioredoxin domain-containing protein n=1 Tax=Cercospora beticola TaxID=122368 RepID=A0A2G5HYH1_CERBT|nr:hypothetical protein CB0940_05386 [Cercospora beticola]PIA97578.1 hypothetical protein CB0940_05386 [Cercospora beticola]WPA97927.1 hypothetical protein RHO25_002538 [Cercospora beticola]CAK1359127.1 unnamed protein product [Cercospora beticola]